MRGTPTRKHEYLVQRGGRIYGNGDLRATVKIGNGVEAERKSELGCDSIPTKPLSSFTNIKYAV